MGAVLVLLNCAGTEFATKKNVMSVIKILFIFLSFDFHIESITTQNLKVSLKNRIFSKPEKNHGKRGGGLPFSLG